MIQLRRILDPVCANPFKAGAKRTRFALSYLTCGSSTMRRRNYKTKFERGGPSARRTFGILAKNICGQDSISRLGLVSILRSEFLLSSFWVPSEILLVPEELFLDIQESPVYPISNPLYGVFLNAEEPSRRTSIILAKNICGQDSVSRLGLVSILRSEFLLRSFWTPEELSIQESPVYPISNPLDGVFRTAEGHL